MDEEAEGSVLVDGDDSDGRDRRWGGRACKHGGSDDDDDDDDDDTEGRTPLTRTSGVGPAMSPSPGSSSPSPTASVVAARCLNFDFQAIKTGVGQVEVSALPRPAPTATQPPPPRGAPRVPIFKGPPSRTGSPSPQPAGGRPGSRLAVSGGNTLLVAAVAGQSPTAPQVAPSVSSRPDTLLQRSSSRMAIARSQLQTQQQLLKSGVLTSRGAGG
jgi:hypothetical protein